MKTLLRTLLSTLLLTVLVGPATAYAWSPFGYVQQIYVKSGGETAFSSTLVHTCGGTSSNYFKVSPAHAAHDRVFAILQAAQLNGTKVALEWTCSSGGYAYVESIKTAGLN